MKESKFDIIYRRYGDIEGGAEWLDRVVTTIQQKQQEGYSAVELRKLIMEMNAQKVGEKLDFEEQVEVVKHACSSKPKLPVPLTEWDGITSSVAHQISSFSDRGFSDRDGLITGLAKGLAQSNIPLEAASSMLVAVNARWKEPLDPKQLSLDMVEGWQLYRHDSRENVEFSITNAAELYGQTMASPDIVINGLMYQGELGMLAGWQGRGKSFFAVGLALSLATEQLEFCGYKLKKFGSVIYIDYEQSLKQINFRLKKHPLGKLLQKAKHQVYFITDAPEITDKKFLKWLIGKIEELKPIMIIVDNVTMAHSGDENSSKDVIKLMKSMKLLVKELDLNIILLHHFKKGVRFEALSLEHVSGSGAWSRLLSFALLMATSAKDAELRIFKADKLRDWPEVHKQPFGAKLQGSGEFIYEGVIENETEHLPQATVTAKGGVNWSLFMKEGVEMSRDQIATELKARGITASVATVARWLKKGVDEGELVHPRDKYYVLGLGTDARAELIAEMGKEVEDIRKNVEPLKK